MRTMKYIMGFTLPVLAVMCLVLLTAGGVYAFFTGKAETVNNRFTIAKGFMDEDGAIVIEEPLWDTTDENEDGIPDVAEKLSPGVLVNKNPSVKSKADYDGWVVMKVTIPKTLASMDKVALPTKQEVFNLVELNEADFTLLDCVKDGDENAVYYYGYKRILKSGASTEELFKKIQVKNFAIVKSTVTGSVDIDAKITQSINPSTGEEYRSVSEAYGVMGGRF